MANNDKYLNEILGYFQNELQRYKSIAIPTIQNLLEGRAPHVKQLNALDEIYIIQNYILDNQQSIFVKPLNYSITLFFSKVAGNLTAIRQCLFIGQLNAASSLNRDIFETYVDMKLILEKDTQERTKLYEEYQHAALWNSINSHRKYLEELKTLQNIPAEKIKSDIEYLEKFIKGIDEKEIRDNYEKVKHNYHSKYPYHWAWKIFKDEIKDHKNPSLDFICKRLGIYDDYLQVYSTASLSVHNHPLMANVMMMEGIITPVPIFSEMTNSIAGISANYVIKIILMTLRYGESQKLEEIELFLNHLFKTAFID